MFLPKFWKFDKKSKVENAYEITLSSYLIGFSTNFRKEIKKKDNKI